MEKNIGPSLNYIAGKKVTSCSASLSEAPVGGIRGVQGFNAVTWLFFGQSTLIGLKVCFNPLSISFWEGELANEDNKKSVPMKPLNSRSLSSLQN